MEKVTGAFGQEARAQNAQKRLKNRPTDQLTDQPIDRQTNQPTAWGVESRSTRLKIPFNEPFSNIVTQLEYEE